MVLFSIVTRTDHLDNQCSHVSGVTCHHCYLSPLCLHLSSVWSRGLAILDFNIMHSIVVTTCLYKCCTSSLYSILIRLQLVSTFVSVLCENFYTELRTTLMQNYRCGIAVSRILEHNCFLHNVCTGTVHQLWDVSLTTSIPCRVWLVSHSTNAASVASRFADIDGTDMFSMCLYFPDLC